MSVSDCDETNAAADNLDLSFRCPSSESSECSSSEDAASSDSEDEICDEDDDLLPSNHSTSSKQSRKPKYSVFLVFWECLKLLFTRCMRCGDVNSNIEKSTKGSSLIVHTRCIQGHIFKWTSQKTTNKHGLGTVSLAASMYISGLSFSTFYVFAKTIELCFMCEKTFYNIVKRFIAPAIKHTFTEHRNANIKRIRDCKSGARLSGDGQFDSPGFCAKYVTYTLMDIDSAESSNKRLQH